GQKVPVSSCGEPVSPLGELNERGQAPFGNGANPLYQRREPAVVSEAEAERQAGHHMRIRAATGTEVGEVEQEGRRETEVLAERIVQSDAERDQPRGIGLNQVGMHE